MGLLLKLALLAVAAYGVWAMARRWLGLLGGGAPQAPAPRPREAQPAKSRAVEDTHPCPVCGAYISASATRCTRSDCPIGRA